MCGRFTLTADIDFLTEWFDIDELTDVPVKPRYNIAPSQKVLTIVSNKGKRRAGFLKWGLIPFWAKNPSIGHKLINARAETVLEKPSFSKAFLRRRCLIPANGFFEWKKEGEKKQPTFIRMKNEKPFAFAGLWEVWKDEKGTQVNTCTILTTRPNQLMGDIHTRMPVILPQKDYNKWLVGDRDPKALHTLLVPYDGDEMFAYNVSSLVNSPRNETSECIKGT